MMKQKITATIAGVIAATTFAVSTAEAQSFRAYNRVIVNPVSSTTFETIESVDNNNGARGLWCAAADYAINRLGASGTSRLYVQTPRGNSVTEPGRKGVVFGLSTPAGTPPVSVTSTSAAMRIPGSNLSVDHAYQFCYDSRLINNR